MPLQALRIFEAAGRTVSFAAAAEELGLSPSAVSHAIRKLEDESGLKLFDRGTRTVTLSEKGRLLLEHVQRGLNEMSHGFHLVTSVRPAPLRLHVAPTFAAHWLVPRLSQFMAAHPSIDLRFAANTDYTTFENDDFDLDIVYGTPQPSPHEKVPLAIEELTPMCAPTLADRLQGVHDLYSLPLIHSDGQSVQWKGWFEANAMTLPEQYALGFDRSSMAISAAVGGLGVALESTLLAERELAAGQLVMPLRHRSQSVRYVGHHLVHPRRHRPHPAFEQFKGWLLSEVAMGALRN